MSSNNDKKKPPFVVTDLNDEYPLPLFPRLGRSPLGLDMNLPPDIKDLIGFITGGGLPPLKPMGIEFIHVSKPNKELTQEDPTKPSHYRADSGIEAIDVIEAWELDFNLGNVIKYICRDGLKNTDTDYIVNLEKAKWYLQREIDNRKAKLQ
jgi:hypothetical protein